MVFRTEVRRVTTDRFRRILWKKSFLAVLKMQINKSDRNVLVKIKRDLENHVRGLLQNLGLVIGRATFNVFAVRAEELIEDRPNLVAAVRPLLEARNAVERQVSEQGYEVGSS